MHPGPGFNGLAVVRCDGADGGCHGGACAGLTEKEENSFAHKTIPGLRIYFSNGKVVVNYQNRPIRRSESQGGIWLKIDIQKDAKCKFQIEFPTNEPYLPDLKYESLKMHFVVALAKWYQKLYEDEKSLVFCECSSEIPLKSKLVIEMFRPLLMYSNSEIMDKEVAEKTANPSATKSEERYASGAAAPAQYTEKALEEVAVIMKDLKDVENAFRQLHDYKNYNYDLRKFKTKRAENDFAVKKQKYKQIRENAWEWLRNNGITPKYRQDYDSIERLSTGTVDTPIEWQVQALDVWKELRKVQLRLRYGPPVPT